jgi:flagellar export protein FliJ
MKSFRFTLEAVRVVRQRQEQNAMENYARTLLARQQAMERLDAVQQQMHAGWQEFRDLLARGCAAGTAARLQLCLRALERRREDHVAALGLAERHVNAAMTAMLAARQQREIVDRCFEKQKTSHQREQLRGEQKFLDDLASHRRSSILAWSPTGAST